MKKIILRFLIFMLYGTFMIYTSHLMRRIFDSLFLAHRIMPTIAGIFSILAILFTSMAISTIAFVVLSSKPNEVEEDEDNEKNDF